MRYLQQTAGYALTGVSNSPQWFFFLHGDSGKGKSTYLETLLGVLGDDKVTGYAHRLNANDITVKAGTG